MKISTFKLSLFILLATFVGLRHQSSVAFAAEEGVESAEGSEGTESEGTEGNESEGTPSEGNEGSANEGSEGAEGSEGTEGSEGAEGEGAEGGSEGEGSEGEGSEGEEGEESEEGGEAGPITEADHTLVRALYEANWHFYILARNLPNDPRATTLFGKSMRDHVIAAGTAVQKALVKFDTTWDMDMGQWEGDTDGPNPYTAPLVDATAGATFDRGLAGVAQKAANAFQTALNSSVLNAASRFARAQVQDALAKIQDMEDEADYIMSVSRPVD
jgi:hypothetical protein